MIQQQTKEILYRVKSPNIQDVLKESMRGYNSYDSNKHNEGSVNMQHVEDLFRKIYTDWFNNLTTHRGKFTKKEFNDLAEKVSTDNRFLPENIANMTSKYTYPFYTFFKKYEKILGTKIGNPIYLQATELTNNNDDLQDVGFVHVFGYTTIVNKPHDSINTRLYLNLKSKNTAQFAILAYEKCKEKDLPFYYKFSPTDDRNDTFLFYVSYENMPQYIEVIESIKLEHPELFEGTEKTSKNFGTLDGYIGYGEEPEIRQSNGDKYSYNQLREAAINEMVDKLGEIKNDMFSDKHSNIAKEAITINPTLTYDGYIDMFINNMIKNHPEFQNCSPEELNSLKKRIKNKFTSSIKKNVINNQPLTDIQLQVNGTDVTLPINENNVYSAFEQCTGKTFSPDRITGMKAYLSKFLVFSSQISLNDSEQRLCQIVKKALIENIGNFVLECKDNELKEKWSTWLEDVKASPKNAVGKNYVVLAAAGFIENGIIRATNPSTDQPIIFNSSEIYQIYEELLGQDTIKSVVDTTCEKYNISNENLCFNASTEKELSQFRRM